jgi:hypothetical protein
MKKIAPLPLEDENTSVRAFSLIFFARVLLAFTGMIQLSGNSFFLM